MTTSIKQFQDLEIVTLNEIIGTPKPREDKIKDFSIKREEKALLAKAVIKNKEEGH